jgi:DNA mismatch repair protein MutS
MFLDADTLHDLEILPNVASRGTTVWALIDRTTTRVGRAALQRRLHEVPQTAADIIERQHAHQAIASDPRLYRMLLDRSAPDAVEEYLNVSWQLPADMEWSVWRRRWYRDYLRDVEYGRQRVRNLLSAAADLRDSLNANESTLLQKIAHRLSDLLNTPAIGDLLRLSTSTSSGARRAFDQRARYDGKAIIVSVLDCIGEVEAFWSIATATIEQGWTYPRPGARLAISEIFHPFLGQRSVRNDLDIAKDVRVCFITGPNMAGKTTFMKAVAIAVFLAHIGCGVPAAAMEFPVVGTIFSSIDISDNLNAGESFYLVEVRRIRALAMALSEHGSGLAVIDEPFRGTNVHDATEATTATVTRLAALPVGVVLVASHVAEVVAAIGDSPGILLIHFSAEILNDQPRFDYKLRGGVSTQRLGMTLLKQERVLELLERLAEAPTGSRS